MIYIISYYNEMIKIIIIVTIGLNYLTLLDYDTVMSVKYLLKLQICKL